MSAFPSIAHFRHGEPRPDCNAFGTALVLRTLGDRLPIKARAGALDFLETCESAAQPGAFRFWPQGHWPDWATDVPEDADDSAICSLELVRAGRRPVSFLREVACKVLLPRRLRGIEPPAPLWIRKGAFLTWLRADNRPNVVDCCVNTNVVALLAVAGLRHIPGYREACEMINDAIAWAAGSHMRAQCITPFYPHAAEFRLALQHAVDCGVAELKGCAEKLPATDTYGPICSSAYGAVYWTMPVLQQARILLQSFGPPLASYAVKGD